MPQECPQMRHISNDDQCLENYAGLGATAYFFLVDDIDKSALVATQETYAWTATTFKEGKGFYKVELRENSQSFTGESQGKRKGFKITGQLIIEVVNEAVSELLRALNNREFGIILGDGEKYQIMYSPSKKVTLESGALKTETGASSSDDRIATLAPVIENVAYSNFWVTFPSGKTPDDYVLSDEQEEEEEKDGE